MSGEPVFNDAVAYCNQLCDQLGLDLLPGAPHGWWRLRDGEGNILWFRTIEDVVAALERIAGPQ